MRPFVQIIGGSGVDLTGGLADRLLSIEVHDEAETKSDRVTIELDDRERWTDSAVLSIPAIGMTISVVMGYRDGAAAHRGTFLIDEIQVSSPPRTLSITGRSADMPKQFRTPRTQSYHQMTLGAIMSEIAGRNGYALAIDPALSVLVVRHIDQHNESDMSFASRLAGLHDAVARPVDGRLAVAKRGTGSSISGQALPVISIRESDCEIWTFDYSARDEAGEAEGLGGEDADQQAAGDAGLPESSHLVSGALGVPGGGARLSAPGGVRAKWTDIRSGETKEVTVGSEPFHDLRFNYHNEAEATAAAAAYRNKAARGKASFTCTIGGNPAVQAEAVLMLLGFRPYMPTAWRIKSAAHRFEAGGYTTEITAELFQPEQEDVPGKVGSSAPGDDDLIDPDAPQGTTTG